MVDASRRPLLHRVDPRLVHATLLEAWLPHFGAARLVVADAAVAADARRRTIFEMSARDVGRVTFVAEVDLPEHIGTVAEDEPTIVVYGSLEGFLDALEAGLECERVLLGHLPDGEDRRRVHPSVYVGREDLELVEQINARGIDVVVRPLPTESPRRLRRGDDGRPVLTDDLQPLERPRAEVSARAAGQASPRGLAAETEEAAPEPSAGGGVRAGTVRVVNERGLHLRAAHLLAQRAARFASSVEVGWPDRLVNAKSLLGITTLGAAQGSELEVRVQGSDADAAWDAIRSLFESGFQEGGG